jgi:hypothetical protein
MPSLDSDFSSVVGTPIFVAEILAVFSAIRKMMRIVSRRILLENTMRKNVSGAPMRSAKMPNQIDVLNPARTKKTATTPAKRMDKT